MRRLIRILKNDWWEIGTGLFFIKLFEGILVGVWYCATPTVNDSFVMLQLTEFALIILFTLITSGADDIAKHLERKMMR